MGIELSELDAVLLGYTKGPGPCDEEWYEIYVFDEKGNRVSWLEDQLIEYVEDNY
jgi:hypothetical protein